MASAKFDPGLGVCFDREKFQFDYSDGVFGPRRPELRTLNNIRKSLFQPDCVGPDPVYAIVMDVGRQEHLSELRRRMLLYGVVAYAAGTLGKELVRSQGHIHSIAAHSGWSTPELVEVWEGNAIVYLQKEVADDPECCVAIEAGPGDVVVIPPSWAHYIANADPRHEMVFGAFCEREYGFVYQQIRERGGLAWFPVLANNSEVEWHRNPAYQSSKLSVRSARAYRELGVDPEISIYKQFARNPECMQWVSEPGKCADLWDSFEP